MWCARGSAVVAVVFSVRVGRHIGRQGEAGRLSGWFPGWADEQAGVGVEGEAVRVGGVAGEGELAAVVSVVVEGAQGQEVAGVGGSAGAPVPEVVDLEVVGGGAAGEAAAAVAVQDQDAGAVGDDAVGAADVDGVSVGLPDRGELSVAGQLVGDVLGQAGAAGEPATVGVEVDLHPVASPPGSSTRAARSTGTSGTVGAG